MNTPGGCRIISCRAWPNAILVSCKFTRIRGDQGAELRRRPYRVENQNNRLAGSVSDAPRFESWSMTAHKLCAYAFARSSQLAASLHFARRKSSHSSGLTLPRCSRDFRSFALSLLPLLPHMHMRFCDTNRLCRQPLCTCGPERWCFIPFSRQVWIRRVRGSVSSALFSLSRDCRVRQLMVKQDGGEESCVYGEVDCDGLDSEWTQHGTCQ